MDLKKIIESIKIIILAFTILTLISQVLDPPLVYVPAFIIPLLGLIAKIIPMGDELGQSTGLELVSVISSLVLTTVAVFYSGFRITNNMKMSLFSAGVAGSLVAGVSHFVALVVINVTVYIPQAIPGLIEELGGLCVLAVPVFFLIQAIPLFIDLILGFILGLFGGFVGKHFMVKG